MSALACAAIERIAGDSYRTVADSLSSSSEFVKAYRGLEIPTAKVVSFAPYLSQKRQQISPLDSIMLSIRQMTDYEQDWDGYGALAPAAQAADDAEFLLSITSAGGIHVRLKYPLPPMGKSTFPGKPKRV